MKKLFRHNYIVVAGAVGVIWGDDIGVIYTHWNTSFEDYKVADGP